MGRLQFIADVKGNFYHGLQVYQNTNRHYCIEEAPIKGENLRDFILFNPVFAAKVGFIYELEDDDTKKRSKIGIYD